MKTLSDLIQARNNGESVKLTDEQKDSFMEVFSKRCRSNTVAKLRCFIESLDSDSGYWVAGEPDYGIYKRVYFFDDYVQYCAGQSYPEEIACIRKCLFEKSNLRETFSRQVRK